MHSAKPDSPVDRIFLIRQAFWLEYVTLGWMTVEAAVTIAFGIVANSLTLVAFGINSVIELASAGILAWRLTVELQRGQAFAESAERKASRIAGARERIGRGLRERYQAQHGPADCIVFMDATACLRIKCRIHHTMRG